MDSFLGLVPGPPSRAASGPSRSAPSRSVSTRQSVHSIRSSAPPVNEKLLNLSFKTANKDDIAKLESWVHSQLVAIHNRSGSKTPEEQLASTFEQIKVLDCASDKIASMIGFHCNLKEEFIRRIWASSADLYNRVFSDLSLTVNDLKFKLMDKSLMVNKLEDALDLTNDRLKAADSRNPNSQSGGTSYEMNLIRQLEAEMLLKNKELMAMQEMITNLSVWFPEFMHYGPSLMKRYLPPVEKDSPATETVDVPHGDVLELAQQYLKKDLKRLEQIGIGFQVKFHDDVVDAHNSQFNSGMSTAIGHATKPNSALPKLDPAFQKLGSFIAAGENEYNLSYKSPSVQKMFFPEEDGVNEELNSAINTVSALIPTAPSPAHVDMTVSDYYTVQSRMFNTVNATATAAPDPAAIALAAAAAAEQIKLADDVLTEAQCNEVVMRYKKRFQQLMLDAQQLESEVTALETSHEREAAMHKKELTALQAEVTMLSGQLAATNSQVVSMTEKLPVMIFPPLIKHPTIVNSSEIGGVSRQNKSLHQTSVYDGNNALSLLLDGNGGAARIPLQNIEHVILKCLNTFVLSGQDDLQDLFGVDKYNYDTYYYLLSGQNALLTPKDTTGGAMTHQLFQFLSQSMGSCSSAGERVNRILHAVKAAYAKSSEQKKPPEELSEVPSFDELPFPEADPTHNVCPSLLSVLFELFQCDNVQAKPEPLSAPPTASVGGVTAGLSLTDINTALNASQFSVVEDEHPPQLEVVYRPKNNRSSFTKTGSESATGVPPIPITVTSRRSLPENIYQDLTHASLKDLRDVIFFDVVMTCFRAMKHHFTPSLHYLNKTGFCGYSHFPIQLSPRILQRIFQPLSKAYIEKPRTGNEEQTFNAVMWWKYLPVHMFERVKFEVEMSSLGRVIPVSQQQQQRQRLNGVNCYDCMLLCWKTVQVLHNHLSVVSSNMYKFLLSIIPQGVASRSFHLLLSHMVQLFHNRENDLDGVTLDDENDDEDAALSSAQRSKQPLPVINLELASELMTLDSQGTLTSFSFANLLLRSLPANLVQNYHHLIATPAPVTISASLTGETKETAKSETELTKELIDNGRILTSKLRSLVSQYHVSQNNSGRQSKATTPRISNHGTAPTESYFKQSLLLNKMLYATETSVSGVPSATATPNTGRRSIASTESDSHSDAGDEFSHHNSVERLLLHTKLCFDENFLKIMPPSISELTFTLVALKYYVGVFTRLIDSSRTLKNRLNRSLESNISNDFVGTLLVGRRDPALGHASGHFTNDKDTSEMDLFVVVENYYVRKLKEKMFRCWCSIGVQK